MRIGIDFDNTIACYDGVFHAAALERGLIPAELGRDKNSVRDYLNGAGRNDDFTELQGHVYGVRMDLVAAYPGFSDFVAAASAAGHELFIVSHKTRHPILGPKHDLHAAARGFLAARGLVGDAGSEALLQRPARSARSFGGRMGLSAVRLVARCAHRSRAACQ